METNLTSELLQAVLIAPDERKKTALRLLQGEVPAPTPPAPEPFLTARQMAAHLHVNPATLWRWNVPGHTFCGCKRYRLSEVLAYLESSVFQARSVTALHASRRQKTLTQAVSI